ncbi:MAG: PIN domain-containing protein [Deltaproteobacteria bacterium]|nr:PIN domain-containing protein [Deltaproteobacteria bacterium]
MIALDTSSLIAYLTGGGGNDVERVEDALQHHWAVLPPAVFAELFSDPKLSREIAALFKELPLLALHAGYWERVGLLRAQILQMGRKAHLADALIAQSCIDHDVPLVTRDPDFRHFARPGGLKLFR